MADVEGKRVWEVLLDPADRDPVRAIFEKLIGGEMPGRYESHWIARDGTRRLISWSNTILSGHGETKHVIGAGIDVTEQRRAEAEVLRARREAEAANAAKDRFLAVLSHELRTPLTPILMAAGIAQKDAALPEATREQMSMIVRNVEIEARLINDLLDTTRISQGKIELEMQPLDIRPVLESTIGICAADIAAKGLRLETDIAGATRIIRADSYRLQQIFWNLVKNAQKFTPAGGEIRVRAGNTNGGGPNEARGVFIEVADTGIGIDPEVLPRIFDPFEQGDRNVTRRFGGLGLGLAIARRMVEMHGGTIRAQSAGPDRGATFRIELPGAREERHAEETAREEETRIG
jgi:two-component system CheB/CheR fusion protein